MTLETYLEGAELDSTTTENLIHAVNAFQNKEITLDEIVEEYGMWYKCIIQEYFMSIQDKIDVLKSQLTDDIGSNDKILIEINGLMIEQYYQDTLNRILK